MDETQETDDASKQANKMNIKRFIDAKCIQLFV